MTEKRSTCDYCGEAIGVYEPVVVVVDGIARESSRAAEPWIGTPPARLFHRTCHLERFGPLAG